MSAVDDELAKAIYNRWNDRSLDTSIAALYMGGEEGESPRRAGPSRRNQSGSPPATDPPRAEYTITLSGREGLSKGSRIVVFMVRFQIWRNDGWQTRQDITTVKDEFINGQKASSNPVRIGTTAGSVLHMADGGSQVIKEDDQLFRGIVQIEVHCSEKQITPS